MTIASAGKRSIPCVTAAFTKKGLLVIINDHTASVFSRRQQLPYFMLAVKSARTWPSVHIL